MTINSEAHTNLCIKYQYSFMIFSCQNVENKIVISDVSNHLISSLIKSVRNSKTETWAKVKYIESKNEIIFIFVYFYLNNSYKFLQLRDD